MWKEIPDIIPRFAPKNIPRGELSERGRKKARSLGDNGPETAHRPVRTHGEPAEEHLRIKKSGLGKSQP
jgi:hypothetical protein